MQEGILSLMQMPRTTIAVQALRDANLPYIVVLTNPTTGGVTASFAMLGDVNFAEPGALIGFAGPRVIEETIKQELPEGFQRSEFLLEHGMVDRVVDRRALKAEVAKVLGHMLGPVISEPKGTIDSGAASSANSGAVPGANSGTASGAASGTASGAAQADSTDPRGDANGNRESQTRSVPPLGQESPRGPLGQESPQG